MALADWEIWKREWLHYNVGMHIQDADASTYMFNCCNKELRREILKGNPTVIVATTAVNDLQNIIQELCVKKVSKLNQRRKMQSMTRA